MDVQEGTKSLTDVVLGSSREFNSQVKQKEKAESVSVKWTWWCLELFHVAEMK